MIVHAELARRVLAGRATQLRIPQRDSVYKPGDIRPLRPHVAVTRTDTDDIETIERHIGDMVGHVQITNARTTHLADLTLPDILAEGFKTRDEHEANWRLHRGGYPENQRVWVLTVKPHADPVRLLAPVSGYTSTTFRALDQDEPEAVDEATQARICARAGLESSQWQQLDRTRREQVGLDQILAETLMLAEQGSLPMDKQLADLKQRIMAANARAKRLAA